MPAGRLIDGRVLDQALEPVVGRGLEPEENIEVLGDRPPRLEQIRDDARRDRRGSAPGSSACECRAASVPRPARGCAPGDTRTDRRRRRCRRRPRRSHRRPIRSIARARRARAVARSNRRNSGTDSHARSRSARPGDAQGTRIRCRQPSTSRRLGRGTSSSDSVPSSPPCARASPSPPLMTRPGTSAERTAAVRAPPPHAASRAHHRRSRPP